MHSSFQAIYIRDDTQQYRKLVAETAVAFRNRSLLPFAGAGISSGKPSCLPMAKALINPLAEVLWQVDKRLVIFKDINANEKQLALNALKDAKLERLLDALQYAYGRSAIEYLSVLNGGKCNFNHEAIAALARNGFLPVCITLNFDLLIEQATRACIVECPLSDKTPFQFGTSPYSLRVIKPHGSLAPDGDPYRYLSATLTEIGSEPARANEKAISEAIDQCRVLLVMGYSDNDWDIFPIIMNQSVRSQKLNRIIWVQYAESEIVKLVKQRGLEQLPKEDLEPLSRHIQPWFRDLKIESVLLIGDVSDFLEDVLKVLSINIPRPDGNFTIIIPTTL